jgi:hypothetical protein
MAVGLAADTAPPARAAQRSLWDQRDRLPLSYRVFEMESHRASAL